MIGSLYRRRIWLGTMALWLLALTASPFTAPFSTFDLLPAAPAATLDSVKTKAPQYDLATVPRAVAAPYHRVTGNAPVRAAARPGTGLTARHAVLRI